MTSTLHVRIEADRIDLALSASTDDAPTVRTAVSIGARTLTEIELHGDPPLAEELTNAIGRVHDLLDDALREMLPHDPTGAALVGCELVGSGAIIEVIAAIEIGRDDRSLIEGFALSRAAAEDVFRTLATERHSDRAHNPGLPADHVPTIVGACCIVVAIMRRLRNDSLKVHTT